MPDTPHLPSELEQSTKLYSNINKQSDSYKNVLC